MTAPPTGTVTFLFTDIEGSTVRWEQHRAAMTTALARHDVLLRGAIESHAGHVFKTIGDAFQAAFASPVAALQAAAAAQRALAAEDWSACGPGFPGLRVRMALHVGPAAADAAGDYRLPLLNRTARLMSAGHGGQVLLSLATQQLVRDDLPPGCTLRDLGLHRLKDLRHSEHIYQLVGPGFPDVRTPPDTAEKLPDRGEAVIDVDLLPAACPYRGLAAFREADARFFFGREAFTERLVASVGGKPMVGVIGPSGSGKSSVVFAGMVPALRTSGGHGDGKGRESATPIGGDWTVLPLRPGAEPFHALAGVLVPLLEGELSETARLVEVRRMTEALADGTLTVQHVAARIRDKHAGLGRLLVVADQFEELYTLCPDPKVQRAFQDLLFEAAHAPAGSGGALKLALTLRADFMGHALAYRPFADAIQDHNVILGPMNHEELTRAIAKPAELQSRAFESGLVERILADVGEEAGSLPLLEFALTKLWEKQEHGWLTHAAYEAIGRVEGAVARHADAVWGGLDEAEQIRARRVFVQLVQPGEGTEDTRRLAAKDELGADWDLARKLADSRLVTTGRDEAGRETAEVVHEALIRSWQRLREWMNADRRFRAWQERLRFGLSQWEASGRDEGALLRGVPLAEAEGWLKERGEALGEGERAYVATGLELRDRRAREREAQLEREAASARKLRRQAIGLAGALVVAVIAGLAALRFGQRATESAARAERAGKVATARELLATSMANLTVDPERSALLALQAVSLAEEVDPGLRPDIETVMHQVVRGVRNVTVLTGHAVPVYDVAYSPDGRHLASAGKDGAVRLWRLPEGTAALTLTQHISEVWGVAFSPDGAQLASVGRGGEAFLWDLATGRRRSALLDHEGLVFDVKFSPDGERLATSGLDEGKVRIWDVATGTQVASLFSEDAPRVGRIAFSADGTRLAISHNSHARVKIWDLQRQQPAFILEGATLGDPRGIMFSPDDQVLAVAYTGGVRLHDALSGDTVLTLRGHAMDIQEVVFSPDGTQLATSSLDQTARVWDARDGHPLGTLLGHKGPVIGIAFSPDGSHVATAGGDGTVRIWDVAPEHELWTVSPSDFDLEDIVVSPGGQRIAIASDDGTARVLDALSGRTVMTLTHGHGRVIALDFDSDGALIATAGDDPPVKLWDATTGDLVVTLTGHVGLVSRVAFQTDGKRIATYSAKDNLVRLWNTESGRQVGSLDRGASTTSDIEFSPDSDTLLSSGGDGVRAYSMATGEALWTLPGTENGTRALAISPDGTRLAAADSEGVIQVWDLPSRTRLATLHGHLRGVTDVEFSKDADLLASGSMDNTAKVWDVPNGRLVVTLVGHFGIVADVAFSPDSTRLYTAAWDDTATAWVLPLSELVTLARSRLTRTLTPEECRQYLHVETCPAEP